jgi:hypothetical protein
MLLRRSFRSAGFVAAIVFAAVGAAQQNQPLHPPDVPFVPTTDLAV